MDQQTPKTSGLALAALGIVFGDIGTSPLYAFQEAFFGTHPLPVTEGNVLGILSLIIWSLIGVVSFKYLGFILQADNRGQGGIFALLSLVPQKRKRAGFVTSLALLGAALLYGDGVITPAISVLSAVEGLEVATGTLGPLVLPLTIGILVGLFSIQKRGTARLGRIFGPVMLVWFLVLAALGVRGIVENPSVLLALYPGYALDFFLYNRGYGFLALGAVVLCLTGAEALYADLGHFGRRPIRVAWFTCAFPALLLNYAGQGAFLLRNPHLERPFYALVPTPLLIPAVALAAIAAVIASQALISGVFSITRQASQLGFLPRVHVVHTSEEQQGQIYIPWVNRLLGVGCVGVVLFFRESSSLAAAYGVAATGDMVITSLVFFMVARSHFRWSVGKAFLLVGIFLAIDLSFFGANIFKFLDGGWFPILLALCLVAIMTTWVQGRRALKHELSARTKPLGVFLDEVHDIHPDRTRGTSVFMVSSPAGTPPTMVHYFNHFRLFHQNVVLLSIVATERPHVPTPERIDMEVLGDGFYRVIAYYGFMETPNVQDVMALAREAGLAASPDTTSYFIGRETLLTTGRSRLRRWRKALFQLLSKNAAPATAYFRLPPGRVVELGMQIEI